MVKDLRETYGLDEVQALEDSTTKLPTWSGFKHKISTKEGWLGDFNFAALCMPSLNPWSKSKKALAARKTPFYGLYDKLPIFLALVCGFQHSLAMLAGVITPPIIFASSLSLPTDYKVYMVAASLICSGLLSAVQMTRFKIPFTNVYFGTGLITVVGTSFATLSTAAAIFTALYAHGTRPMVTAADGTKARGPCPDAYGYLLGTAAVCSLLEMALSFAPPKALKKIFPPMITGMVVMLIGASLIGHSGFLNWAGGSGTCASRPTTGLFVVCPQVGAPHALPWGSPEYIGLGFLTFISIIIIELFGSPFMRNASIIIGLVIGLIVSGPLGYVDPSYIKSSPAITFIWVKTFKLRIYGPAVLPLLSVYVVLAMEAIGDITASSEASRQPVQGLVYDTRISGGILADGVNGMLSALLTNCPMSIFAQNNGVISITRCGNRTAGYFCAALMVFYGVVAKVSGVFLSIPAPVLGGVTTFLFATVFTSGIKVMTFATFTRRNRIVMAAGLSVGLGSLLVPDWANHIFSYTGTNSGLKGLINSVVIVLSTPFLIGGLISILVNLILPEDVDDDFGNDKESDDTLEDDRAEAVLPKNGEPSGLGKDYSEDEDEKIRTV